MIATEVDFTVSVDNNGLIGGVGVDDDGNNFRTAVEVNRAAERDCAAQGVGGILGLATGGGAIANASGLGRGVGAGER